MISDARKPEASMGSSADSGRQYLTHFFKTRQRIYNGLLIFVVAVGLPIVSVPALRHRLSSRVQALRTALSGELNPVRIKVGENRGPLPAEYERPLPLPPSPMQLPPLDRIFTKADVEKGKVVPPAVSRAGVAPRLTKAAPKSVVPAQSDTTNDEPAASSSATSDEPKYQQGKIEQEAYELLLKSIPAVAALVQGSDSSLRFRSWDAAKRSDDLYWVRLRFQSEGKPETEYIWMVKLLSGQVVPLSYNARSIS
jgi:hypothetical protein